MMKPVRYGLLRIVFVLGIQHRMKKENIILDYCYFIVK